MLHRTLQKYVKEPPLMGRKKSLSDVKNVIMVAGVRVDRNKITLSPNSMWLKTLQESGRKLPKPMPEEEGEEWPSN